MHLLIGSPMLYAIKIQDAYELNVIEKGGGPAVEEATTADIIMACDVVFYGEHGSPNKVPFFCDQRSMQGIAFFSQHNPNDVRAPRGTIDMGAAQQKS